VSRSEAPQICPPLPRSRSPGAGSTMSPPPSRPTYQQRNDKFERHSYAIFCPHPKSLNPTFAPRKRTSHARGAEVGQNVTRKTCSLRAWSAWGRTDSRACRAAFSRASPGRKRICGIDDSDHFLSSGLGSAGVAGGASFSPESVAAGFSSFLGSSFFSTSSWLRSLSSESNVQFETR